MTKFTFELKPFKYVCSIYFSSRTKSSENKKATINKLRITFCEIFLNLWINNMNINVPALRESAEKNCWRIIYFWRLRRVKGLNLIEIAQQIFVTVTESHVVEKTENSVDYVTVEIFRRASFNCHVSDSSQIHLNSFSAFLKLFFLLQRTLWSEFSFEKN